jgi:hypothetical protein
MSQREMTHCMTPKEALESLSADEQVALRTRDQFYGGSWEAMTRDYRERLARPGLDAGVAERIRKDLAAAERVEALERQVGARLALPDADAPGWKATF